MRKFKISCKDDILIIHGVTPLDIARSCACGQSFRWQVEGDGFFGVVRGRGVFIKCGEGDLEITPSCMDDAPLWLDYFDLERDYCALESQIALDDRLAACLPYASGIHVFNQEPFEALISFIISANNNIKRISGIVERLCALTGDKKSVLGREYFAFPTPESVAALSVEALQSIGAGYRAPFIKKSAAMIADGYELEKLRNMPLNEARRELLAFPGVGPKVADCVLLFSLGHTDAFPIDVWMDRAMRALFFENDQPLKSELEAVIERLGPYSGIVQQYIFHYARAVGIGIKS